MKNVFLLLFVFLSATVCSQHAPHSSQYLRNQFLVNPGASGVSDFTEITIGSRMQWVGFTDAPKTNYIVVSKPLKSRETINPGIRMSNGVISNPVIYTGKFKHAVGGQFLEDQYGAFRKMQLLGTYAVHLPLTTKINLSFGSKIGWSNNTFLQDHAIVKNASTKLDDTYISFISSQKKANFLNMGVGLYLYSKSLFLGISAEQLMKNYNKFDLESASFNPKIHSILTGGIKLPLNENVTISPAFLVKYLNPLKPSIEGTVQLEFKEWLWTAFSYRQKDAIIGIVGMNLSNKFKMGYSYDFSISRLKSYNSGGHELVLGILLR